MAGIGWRLERLMRGGIAGATAAYATGAAVMALPWMLTTAVLFMLPLVLGRAATDLGQAGTIVNVAYAVALLVAGPVQVVISRHSADCLFEGRVRSIAAPFCRGLGVTFLLCVVVSALALLALDVPLRAVVWGAVLTAAVGSQWTALAVGNGLCSPTRLLLAVVAGSGVSFVSAAALVVFARLGLSGYLFGLAAGQTLTLALLLAGIFRALPENTDEHARLLPAWHEYATLAVSGLAFNASLWIDKLVAWLLVGGETAALHAGGSTLAWFSTIPCLAWIFVEVESTFYRRFRAFYRSLEGGAPLATLRAGVRGLQREAVRLLLGAASVQAGVCVFLQVVAEPVTHALGLPREAVLPYRLLLLAASAQALGLLGLILLYYFDLRREACVSSLGFLAGITLCASAAASFERLPAAGTVIGCALGAVFIWWHVFRGIGGVLEQTMLDQPFGLARRRMPRGMRRIPPAASRRHKGLGVSPGRFGDRAMDVAVELRPVTTNGPAHPRPSTPRGRPPDAAR